MSIGSILIGIAMLALAIPFVISPLIGGKRKESQGENPQDLNSSGDRHRGLLLALRDLEFDHQIGKITDEDYTDLRATLLVQAGAALEDQEKHEADLDAKLEQAIQMRRAKQSKPQICSQCGTILESSARYCRTCGKPVELTCPNCGGKIHLNDLFCNGCGAPAPAIRTPSSMEGSL